MRREMFHEALQATQGCWIVRLWGNGAPEDANLWRFVVWLSCSSARHHAKQPSFVWLPSTMDCRRLSSNRNPEGIVREL